MTGFDDLNEAGKGQVEGTEEEETVEEAIDSATSDPLEESPETAAVESSMTKDQGRAEPAFPFDDAVQAQIYPRQSTHDEFTDFLDIEVKRLLRERDIRNEEGRELHEAVLQVAMEHPEEIAEKVAEQRTDPER